MEKVFKKDVVKVKGTKASRYMKPTKTYKVHKLLAKKLIASGGAVAVN